MKIVLKNILIRFEEDTPEIIQHQLAETLGLGPGEFTIAKILKKSLDARKKNQFFHVYHFVVDVPEGYNGQFPKHLEQRPPDTDCVKLPSRPLIVGFGPAGIFAALRFAECGIAPVILERGRNVEERHRDIQAFNERRVLDVESNIQFGEGGAGTYSDGKLTTRLKDSHSVDQVFSLLVKFGAPPEILYLNKPHLGTDLLRVIVKNIRSHLLELGAEIHFSSRFERLICQEGVVKGIRLSDGREFFSDHVLLAIGHSARDTLELLDAQQVALQAKSFAVGTRIEHPSEVINEMQYGRKYFRNKGLEPADYAFTCNPGKRGVFSFCMCPGGEVVAAASEHGMSVVNGMSFSSREGAFSNSAIVVQVTAEDFESQDVLAGIGFQRGIERRAFMSGGGSYHTPAQNLADFMQEKTSEKLLNNSHRIGTTPSSLDLFLPPFICEHLRNAFQSWKQRFPMFISDKAILIGAETRTSSPVRMLRDSSGQSVSHKGLYPIGEGAGYAGGITSSAVDGLKCAQMIIRSVAG